MKVLFLILILFLLIFLKNKKKSTFGNSECKPLPVIDKIFVLSMKVSQERRQNFLNSYKNLKSGIPLQIIWGVDTKIPKNAEPFRDQVDPYKFSIMYDLDSGKRERTKLSEFNSGALGCYLGHMEFYRECFRQKLKYALICEDNVVFSQNFLAEWKSLSVPNDFDVLFFHAWNTIGEYDVCNSRVKTLKKVMGTKCYLINVESMKRYYQHFFPIDNHVDFKYRDLIEKGCRVYYYPLNTIEVVYTKESSTIGHSVIKSELIKNVNSNEISHHLFEIE